jgi:phage terminase large subunit-like protein
LAGPSQWGKVAVNAYDEFQADRIIGEKNFGGAMVGFVVKTAAAPRTVPFKEMTASRGKAIRAEPISALYSKTDDKKNLTPMIHHVGFFPELEEQLCNFTNSGYEGDRSPDRADALIWAATDLLLTAKRPVDTGGINFGLGSLKKGSQWHAGT